jgi:tRNA(Ile)-lysidine synthase
MLAALDRQRYKIHCLHVDHGLRPESREDALAVKVLCKSFGVPCRVATLPPGLITEAAKRGGLGIEGAARIFRHKIWNQEARRLGAVRILVGHTRDDLLETALMRFLRGSGPAGLGAMPREKGLVTRPLITLSRQDALLYLRDKGIPFRTDATNEDIQYLRNRIRHTLVPCLDAYFPYWRKTVLSLAETQRLAADFLDQEAQKQAVWEPDPKGNALYTREARFFALHPLIREEAVFQAADRLAAQGKKSGAFFTPDILNHKEAAPPRRKAVRFFTENPCRAALDLGAVRLERRRGNVVVRAGNRGEQEASGRGFALLIKEAGVYTLKGLRIVCEIPVTGECRAAALPSGLKDTQAAGFFACLPVVFRREYVKGHERIIAEDRKGWAASIFSDKDKKKDAMILRCKEECKEEKGAEKNRAFLLVTFSGGIDA